jgi:hypothetical protein
MYFPLYTPLSLKLKIAREASDSRLSLLLRLAPSHECPALEVCGASHITPVIKQSTCCRRAFSQNDPRRSEGARATGTQHVGPAVLRRCESA